MNELKKAFIYSPLMGGVFSGIIIWVYSLFLISQELSNTNIDWNIFTVLINGALLIPVLFVITIALSYLSFYPFFFIKELINKKILLKEGMGWAIMFLLGFITGLMIAFVSHDPSHYIKSIIIVFCFSFGSMFNASLFSVLAKKTKVKNQ